MRHLSELLPRARAEGFLIAQGIACIESALRLSQMTERERWDVDLSVPRFEWREGDSVIFGGPCQLLGTFVEGDGFLWGLHNPSVPEAGWRLVKERLHAMDDVTPFLETRAFDLSRSDASLLMQWLAVRMGFTGCFEGPVGTATSFLAATLNEGQGAGGWCAWCGSTRAMVKTLIAGPRGVMVCDGCGALMGDLLEGEPPSEPGQPLDVSAHPALRWCVFCEEAKGGLLMGPYAGACRGCAGRLAEVLKGQAGG